MKQVLIACVAVAAFAVTGVALPAQHAPAATTYTVYLGEFAQPPASLRNIPGTINRFLPSTLVIAAGDKVVVYYASANRDDAVFSRPGVFDVGRTPNDHMTFGVGPHFCLGAGLARLQMSALFGQVLDHLHDVDLAGDVVRLRSNFQNGIKRLPITYRFR